MKASNLFRCFVMGGESLLVQCGEVLLAEGHSILGVITDHDEIVRWAEERNLRVIPPGRDLAARIGTAPFEWLFSIANLSIIPSDVLALPLHGAINFHDGPLPRYAGLNATTWAILHGERTHGVTWHRIEGSIDEGDILEQRIFELTDRETALTLNTRCYELGIDTFAKLVRALARREEKARPQDLSQRTYFGRYDRPPAACTIDFGEPAHRIDALVRALDYGRYPNPIGVPKVVLDRGVLLLPEVERGTDTVSEPPGTVIAIDDRGLEVATATESLLFPKVLDASGHPITREAAFALGVRPGAQLALPRETRERLTAIDADLARHESFWIERLATCEPAQLPMVDLTAATAGGRPEHRRIEGSAEAAQLIATLAVYVARTTAKTRFDLGFRHPTMAERVRGADSLYADFVPLRVEVDRESSFAALEQAVRAELDSMIEHGTYPHELAYRHPRVRMPEWQVVFEYAPSIEEALPPAPIAIVTDESRAALVFDPARCTPRAAEALRERIELLLTASREAPATPVRTLPLLSPEERRRVLSDWNATTTEHPRDRCVHHLVEAQVDRTPEARALIFRDRTLTYRELDRRASQLAHHLIALGVGPDTPVGLCTDRSLDLVVGVLGILKAGGAYVPLDPTYPAERIALVVDDCRARVIVTNEAARSTLPAVDAAVVLLNDAAIANRPDERPATDVSSASLAYLLYTSGSTGTPKGVMVEHRNVVSFFAGMDRVIHHDPPGVWLAVTSLSFDISVLELLYTLARGFTVVLSSDEDRTLVTGGGQAISRHRHRPIDFALFYFASDEGERAADKYRLLLDGARFADEHGFSAVWTPERHFHAFGGLYPNPSVVSAALAVITKRVKLRAGSCVSPLHHPVRVAEEWALVDNLSGGRVGISFAAGWQPNDFVLRPDSFEDNKARMIQDLDVIRRLWRGETIDFPGPQGSVPVRTLPRPVQKELPFWITAAGNPDTFQLAGRLGGGILTHLLGQTFEEVKHKIELYRMAWREAGHPGDGHAVLMLHTFVGPDPTQVRETVREPMKAYLRSSMQLIQQHAWSFPAFRRLAREDRSFKDNFMSLSKEDTDALLDHSFERYYETSGLFGTIDQCAATIDRCREIGVDEVACLIDYGVPSDVVLAHLPYLAELRERASRPVRDVADHDYSLSAQLVRHGVTHMQCTPSMARMLLINDETRAALRGLEHLMIGGELFPGSLARDLREATRARITNMYGPTETTVWSSTEEVEAAEGAIAIGRPIANTRFYLLDEGLEPLPPDVPGELYIGGDGVARGYWARPELTDARFVPDPFASTDGARMYRTGDLVRYREDGCFEFLGRVDHQVKIRGYRIELGEIEARLTKNPSVREAVVIAREDAPGDVRLAAYVVPNGSFDPAVLKAHLRAVLPEFMVPAHIVRMDRFPLTPNQKVDRLALPRPELSHDQGEIASESIVPRSEMEEAIADIWKRLLGLDRVSIHDNFFELGGHSLLAVQAHRELKDALGRPELTITDIFRFPTISALAAHLEGAPSASAVLRQSAHRAAARRHAAAGTRRMARRR